MGIKLIKETGLYHVTYSKRHPVTGMPFTLRRMKVKSKIEAVRLERELILQLERKITDLMVPKWSTFLESFYTNCRERGLKEKSVYDYKVCLDKYTLGPWGDKNVNMITPDEIRSIINGMTAVSEIHRQNVSKFIRAAFSLAVERRLIPSNPCPNMRFKKCEKIKKVLTEAQARLLLGRAKDLDNEWYPHWMLALYLGLRNGELYALKWEKVDFDTMQVLVDTSWNRKDGFKSTKSGDDRMVPINEKELLPFLRELRLKTGATGYVLPRYHRWEKGEQARELRNFLKALGLPEIRFHDLRASWATMLLSKGLPAVQVMSMGGWKDYKTMVIYLRKAGIDIRGATDVLNLDHRTGSLANVLNLGICSTS